MNRGNISQEGREESISDRTHLLLSCGPERARGRDTAKCEKKNILMKEGKPSQLSLLHLIWFVSRLNVDILSDMLFAHSESDEKT